MGCFLWENSEKLAHKAEKPQEDDIDWGKKKHSHLYGVHELAKQSSLGAGLWWNSEDAPPGTPAPTSELLSLNPDCSPADGFWPM